MGNPKGLTKSGSGELGIIVCGRVPWLYQYWPGGFMLFVVLCPGTPGGSTGSGSGFKASQKTGQMACSLIRQTGRTRNSIFVTLPTPRVDMDFDFQCTF